MGHTGCNTSSSVVLHDMKNKALVIVCAVVGISCAAKLDGLHHSTHHGAHLGAHHVDTGNLRLSVNTDSHTHQESELASSSNEAAVTGSYSWTAPNGESFTVTYVADEGGFRPVLSRGGSVTTGTTSSNRGVASFGTSSEGSGTGFSGSSAST